MGVCVHVYFCVDLCVCMLVCLFVDMCVFMHVCLGADVCVFLHSSESADEYESLYLCSCGSVDVYIHGYCSDH